MMNNAYVNGTSALKEDSKVIEFRVVEQKKQPKNSNYVANYKVGEKQEVYPFRSEEDLQKMHNYFVEKGQDRNDMMFIVGINVGLRAGDLLTLTWDKIMEEGKIVDGVAVRGKIVDGVTVKEEKTGKFRTFYFNSSCKAVLEAYFDKHNPALESYVFASRKGDYVNVKSAGKILKTAAKAVGIKYNVGTHSMRKTFGYHQLKAHNNDAMFVCQLQEMFGHSSPQITLRYCGLETEKLQQYYNDINLL